jgi:hypothetical protein
VSFGMRSINRSFPATKGKRVKIPAFCSELAVTQKDLEEAGRRPEESFLFFLTAPTTSRTASRGDEVGSENTRESVPTFGAFGARRTDRENSSEPRKAFERSRTDIRIGTPR